MTIEPLLQINDLCLEYRQNDLAIPVLDGVSLSLAPGETLGLIGESGCGKTSLAMTVMGLAKSARVTGDIRFNGIDLTGLKDKEFAKFRWNRIALVFQNSQEVFNPVITVGEQVAETLIWHLGLSRAAASQQTARLFKQVGLKPVWQHAYAHQLSGGMRQRVLIAMAVACSPDLLIVDEPFTALDAATASAMADLILTLQQHLGFAMILISHAMPAIATLPLVHLSRDTEFVNQPCHVLSGGQRQRVSVARALVTDPVLLIADEITAMLDPSAQAHLLRMLKGLQHKKGFSMLFISHNIHLARKIADRAYVLEQGKIVTKGAGYEVFESANPSEITFKTRDHLYNSGQSLE